MYKDYSVQNDESLCGHWTNERRVRKRDKKVWFKTIQHNTETDWALREAAVTCDGGRLFHRRSAATGDRRVRRTSRDVAEAERNRRLASVPSSRRDETMLTFAHAKTAYRQWSRLSSGLKWLNLDEENISLHSLPTEVAAGGTRECLPRSRNYCMSSYS